MSMDQSISQSLSLLRISRSDLPLTPDVLDHKYRECQKFAAQWRNTVDRRNEAYSERIQELKEALAIVRTHLDDINSAPNKFFDSQPRSDHRERPTDYAADPSGSHKPHGDHKTSPKTNPLPYWREMVIRFLVLFWAGFRHFMAQIQLPNHWRTVVFIWFILMAPIVSRWLVDCVHRTTEEEKTTMSVRNVRTWPTHRIFDVSISGESLAADPTEDRKPLSSPTQEPFPQSQPLPSAKVVPTSIPTPTPQTQIQEWSSPLAGRFSPEPTRKPRIARFPQGPCPRAPGLLRVHCFPAAELSIRNRDYPDYNVYDGSSLMLHPIEVPSGLYSIKFSDGTRRRIPSVPVYPDRLTYVRIDSLSHKHSIKMEVN